MKKAMRINENTCKLIFNGDTSDEFYKILNAVKNLYGRKFIPAQKVWHIPITKSNIEALANLSFDIEESILTQLYQITTPVVKIKEEAFNKNLYPFQKEGVQMMENFGGNVLLGDEMGLGKTIQSIEYLNIHPEDRPALIICPATMKLVWRRELHNWLKHPERSLIIESKTIVDETYPIYIINYDILEKRIDTIIETIRPRTIILDECHKIKNSKAKRTKATKEICKSTKKIIALSGTPIVNRPMEFWNTLSILRPKLFTSFWMFAQRYCGAHHNGYGWNFNGATHQEELHKLLTENVMIRRLKKDVLKDLPEKVKTVIPINSFKDSDKQKYIDRQKQFTNWLMENRSAKQPTILAQIEELKQNAFKMKYPSLIEWIEDFIEDGKKLVVFFTHHNAIDAVYEKFRDCSLKLDGRTPMKDRDEIVKQFQTNPQYKLFLGNIQAAGVGITLTAADSCLFTELAWTPGDHTQAEDRIHRIGQKNSVNIYYMIATNTIEEDIIEVIDEKRKNLDKVLDGKETETENILSMILKRIIAKEEINE